MTLAAVSMSTDFEYTPTNNHTVAVFIGFVLFHGVLNTLNTAWLARITKVYSDKESLISSIMHSSTLLVRLVQLSLYLSVRKIRRMVILCSWKSLIARGGVTMDLLSSLAS
jgi:hypothetical protein